MQMRFAIKKVVTRTMCILLLLLSTGLCREAWLVAFAPALVPADHDLTRLALPVMMLDKPELPEAGPDFVGLATWYGGEEHIGRQTRSGEAYDPEAAACAVPQELWDELAGKTLRLQNMDGGNAVLVQVNDSGYLSEAGRFTWEVRRVGEYDVARWWPDNDGLPIVVDLTPAVHKQLSPTGQTVQVKVWIEEASAASTRAEDEVRPIQVKPATVAEHEGGTGTDGESLPVPGDTRSGQRPRSPTVSPRPEKLPSSP